MLGLKMSVQVSSVEIWVAFLAVFAPNISMSNPETKEGMFHLKGVIHINEYNFLNV